MLSPRTLDKLNTLYPPGTRHKAKIDIALGLFSGGETEASVSALLHDKFPNASAKEIAEVIQWCTNAANTRAYPGPTASSGGFNPGYAGYPARSYPSANGPSAGARMLRSPFPGGNGHPQDPRFARTPQLSVQEAVATLLNGGRKRLQSPVEIPPEPLASLELLLEALYHPDECINIVTKHLLADAPADPAKSATGDEDAAALAPTGRACPRGPGANKTPSDWILWLGKNGYPKSPAGGWMRPNPVKARGSGRDGAITNADVTALRFLLLESDAIPVADQLAVYAELSLPIAAIISSGGKSCHAWLRMDCQDPQEYELKATRILAALGTLRFDKANKNPSRLSRLPGAVRKIGAAKAPPEPAKPADPDRTNTDRATDAGTDASSPKSASDIPDLFAQAGALTQGARLEGLQALLYLDPNAPPITAAQIDQIEFRVAPPRFPFVPMRQAVSEAVTYYDAMYRYPEKTGLRTGFDRFDKITGGLKPGWLTVVAGETNSGKTSFALNIVGNALRAGKTVVVFSFEMEFQEILDIFFAQETRISRNFFNTGGFSIYQINTLLEASRRLEQLPLYVYDNPLMTTHDMTEACQRIACQKPVDLVVVDYLQLANVDNPRDNREQQVAATSRACKAMAKILRCPVLGISQLNDEGKMRESRGIAHDANAVLKVKEEQHGGVTVEVTKGRSIPKGKYFYTFHRETCRFHETGCDERLAALL